MKAYITITKVQQIEIDVDQLVEECGPRAKTQRFLKDYAAGNHSDGGVIIEMTFDGFEKEVKPPKVRRGIGSY